MNRRYAAALALAAGAVLLAGALFRPKPPRPTQQAAAPQPAAVRGTEMRQISDFLSARAQSVARHLVWVGSAQATGVQWTDGQIVTIGTAGTSGRARTYVRDPEQELADQTVTDFEPAAELPSAAAFTGYSSDDGELWLDPARQDQVAYVVSEDGGDVEAWPRTETLIGCD